MSRIRILVADDHQMFRTGIVNLLAKEAEFEVVGEASDGNEVVRMALQLQPDVVLMDVQMPFQNGILATKEIVQGVPGVKILALTSFEDEEYVMNIIRAGAKGYILKEAPFEELMLALKTVAVGSSYFAKDITHKLFARLDYSDPVKPSTAPAHPAITVRELEILRLIAEENTNREIGEQLFISPRTVETHRRNLIQKLKVKNTAGLLKFFHGLVE